MMEKKPLFPYELIRPVVFGLLFSFGTILVGEVAGLAFSRYSAKIKESYKAEVKSHKRDVFLQEKEIKKTISKTWLYTKRFHYHAMGLGAISLVIILALMVTWVSASIKKALSLGLGVGALLIPSGWFLTALKASYMGADAAKKSLEALILFCVGLHTLSIAAVFVIYILWIIYKDEIPDSFNFLK